ncbi:hypothetical protein M3Y99_00746400 [Aphelenchoides fujianensis]|nr:hypothetical protein M3Y99_00746400 [Aphelenchoides fujianensis]
MRSVLFVLLLAVLTAEVSSVSRRNESRSLSTPSPASSQPKDAQVVPFVRRTKESPQTVEMLIGTPPQKLKVALIYPPFEKRFEHVLLFHPRTKRTTGNAKACKKPKRTTRFYNLK